MLVQLASRLQLCASTLHSLISGRIRNEDYYIRYWCAGDKLKGVKNTFYSLNLYRVPVHVTPSPEYPV